jgi:hypothetical protein
MKPQIEELACLYVLDRLNPGERAAFEDQVDRDPELAVFVAELEEAANRRIRELPQTSPSPSVLARIEEEIGRAPILRTARPARSPWWAPATWAIAAAAAVAIGLVSGRILQGRSLANKPTVIVVNLGTQGSESTTLAFPGSARGPDERFMHLATMAQDYWEKPEGLPGRSAKAERAFALFDPTSNQGFIAIRNLPPPQPGRRYRLWIFDPSTRSLRDAGELPAGDSPRGLYSFSVSPDEKGAAEGLQFFVTAEDPDAPPAGRPSGSVVLGNRPI